MIIYAVLTDTFVGDLYLAGLFPGILLAGLFSLAIFVLCIARPSLSGTSAIATWAERFASLRYLIPPIALFLIVVGSIYAGIATPTEAASLGVVASLGLGVARRRISWRSLLHAFEGTMRTTAMVLLIVLAAFFLNFVLTNLGVTRFIENYMKGLDVSPLLGILAIIVLYLILGMFMETLSLMIATLPIVFPVAMALGFDKVWFGVLFIVLIEAALITPPIGMNLFVVQAIRGKGPFRDVVVGSVPFLIMMLVLMALLVAFPELALWAPKALSGR
jgi:tripartite ATP-independent transporter DctM subunit